MATTTHPVALFEEGFMLVGVDTDDIETLGEQAVFDLVQNHPWVVEKAIPVVLAFETEDGEMEAFGDQQLVDTVTEMDFDEINWGHELTLEWPEGVEISEERLLHLDPEGGLHLNLTVSDSHQGDQKGAPFQQVTEKWKIDYLELEVSGRAAPDE